MYYPVGMRNRLLLTFYCFASLVMAAAQSLPSSTDHQQQPTRLAFEVASIRASAPQPMGTSNTSFSSDGAMVRSSYLSLEDYVRIAYRMRDFQVKAPSWAKSTRFDIQAKIPNGLSRENVPEMLQSLLAERFDLAVHRESQKLPVIALVVAKNGPRLVPTQVSAANRSLGRSGGTFGRRVKLRYATLADLAQAISPYSDRPVVDRTGISGNYDFDLTYSSDAASDSATPAGADSEAAVSLPEALKKYGLELKVRKAPVEVLVVDHIDKAPTDN